MSYRRQDTEFPAGWLYDRLSEHFPGGEVFKDVDAIRLGEDYVAEINRAVGSCDALLALIGPQWLTVSGAGGGRRIDDEHDFVRLEIMAALERDVLVVPILVGGATMPAAEDLPPAIRKLAYRTALELSPRRFDFDVSQLIDVLDEALATAPAAAVSEAPPPERPAADPPGARRSGSPSVALLSALSAAAVVVAVVLVIRALPGGADEPPQSGRSTHRTEPISSVPVAPAAAVLTEAQVVVPGQVRAGKANHLHVVTVGGPVNDL